MLESLNRLMLAGVGALSMTRERAEKIFDEYVQRGQAERADRQGFVKDLLDTADKTRLELEDLVNKQVRQSVEKLNLVSREDLARVEAKLDALLSRGA